MSIKIFFQMHLITKTFNLCVYGYRISITVLIWFFFDNMNEYWKYLLVFCLTIRWNKQENDDPSHDFYLTDNKTIHSSRFIYYCTEWKFIWFQSYWSINDSSWFEMKWSFTLFKIKFISIWRFFTWWSMSK
jgi:hypothetical protein